MKKQSLMLAGLVVLIGTLISVSVYAEKEHKAKKKSLPEPVIAAVESLYPQAVIEEIQTEKEGIMVYEIEVEQGEAEFELSIAPDGTLLEQEQEISIGDLPEVIQQAIGDAEVEEATKEVTYWVVTLTKLDTPEITYEVELKQDGKEMEIEFAADGTVLDEDVSDDDDDHDHDHDDDDDD